MKALRGFTETMTWVETGKRSYALHAGGDIVATLSWPKGFGSPAHAETAEGRVSVERSGLLRPRVVVREEAAPASSDTEPASQRAPLVSLEVDLGGRGVARTRTEKTLNWTPLNLWRTTWAFEESGKMLVTFEADSAVKFGHKVRVNADVPDLGTLVLLGSAVGVFLSEDSAIFGI
jgi:hypothetical protein